MRSRKSSAVARVAAPKPVKAALPPCVLHGGWVPDETAGRFLVWAEVVGKPKRPRPRDHPYQLRRAELATLLAGAWPSLGRADDLARKRSKAWIVLPGNGFRPSASLELQAERGADTAEPNSWKAWRVYAVEVANPVALLSFLDLKPIQGTRTIRLGQDLEFWQRLAERLAWAIRRHEYLPAIYAGTSASKGRGLKPRQPKARFQAGWEFAQGVEDRIVATFSRAMPGASSAMWATKPIVTNREPTMHDPEGLVRHFLAVSLQRLVVGTRFTKTAAKLVENSVVALAIAPDTVTSATSIGYPRPIAEPTWAQWLRWRERIQRSALDADERICFRLAEANSASPDSWRLQWLLSSRRDLSLLMPLTEFWARGSVVRPSPRSMREVLLQLGQAARLYGKLWAGMNSAAPAEVLLDRDEALEFLRKHGPILQGAGFRVIVPAWWTATGQRRLRLRLATRGSASSGAQGTESSGMFGFDTLVEFNAQVVMDGKPLTPEEWERVVAAKEGLVEIRGQWMELQADELARLEEYWASGGQAQTMTVADLLRTEADSDSNAVDVVYEDGLGRVLSALRNSDSLEILEQPAAFVGMLREYQVRGFSWLLYLERIGLGACLADDMGLGKTIQVLATILEDKARNPDAGPTLLVAPTSVLGNWQREAKRFAPSLSTRIHHGPKRAKGKKLFKESIRGADMVIASFGVARLDAATLSGIAWHRLVVDESQNVKNPTAAVTKAIRRIKARRRIALTGTPVENRLMDLWSLFSFINPGFLGTMTDFRKNVERPIMRDRDRAATSRLRGMVRPFILRRMKTDKAIIKDLPDKVEHNSFCNLTPEQATLYEAVVRKLEKNLKDAEGIGRQGLMLSTLMRLKQICNHPAQFLQDGSKFAEKRSHKLARVCEMLDEVEAENESALVFTQFAQIGKSLETLFRRRYGGAVYYLHGGTPRARREHMVEEFQHPDTERAVFVLSLRAGGTGITLTRANHVIHFDRWWNPAVENQATDRAYRIGQKKSVFVHKMVTMGTLEERIDELIESKKQLAEDIVGGDESWLANLDNDAFRQLIVLDRGSAVVG